MGGLILHHDCVPYTEGRESLATSGEDLLLGQMALGQGTFSHFCGLPPLSSDREVARLEGEMITEDTPKDDLGGRETSERIRTVSVEEESTSHLVTVKGSIGTQIVHNHPLCTLHTDLCTFIRSGIIV